MPQFGLFSRSDRFFGSAKQVVATLLDFNKNQRLVIDHDQINFTCSIAIVCSQQYKILSLRKFGSKISGPMIIFSRSAPVMAIAQLLIDPPERGSTEGIVQMVLTQSHCITDKFKSRHRISIPDTL